MLYYTAENIAKHICNWMETKRGIAGAKGFVVGVSGGIDSALVSMLCAKTGSKTLLVQMPIHRKDNAISRRADKHVLMLKDKYKNVEGYGHDLSSAYDAIVNTFPFSVSDLTGANIRSRYLTGANIRSRLRMVSLYSFANQNNCLVVGTGNKVEDYGVGFFTKYGDGGVDISPIGELLKSEVRELSGYLDIDKEIVNAVPTDELWEDGRSDEDAIGATYDELEWAMRVNEDFKDRALYDFKYKYASERQKKVLEIYKERHDANQHKMEMPEICSIKN